MGYGKNLKKRRKVVSRRGKKNANKVVHVTRGDVREEYVKLNGTAKQRLEALGLATDANKAIGVAPTPVKLDEKVTPLLEKWADVDTQRNITGHRLTADRRPAFWLSEEDRLYIKAMVDKYGDDIDAMFRDIKLNKYQKTKAWLRKHVDKYHKFIKANPELAEIKPFLS